MVARVDAIGERIVKLVEKDQGRDRGERKEGQARGLREDKAKNMKK